MTIPWRKSAAEGDGGEEGIEAQPAEDEGTEEGVISVGFLQEDQGEEQGGGEDYSCKQGGQEPEQFLETEKKPGAIDVKNPQSFRFKGGGRQQAAEENQGGQQGMMAERSAVSAQMFPGQNPPHDLKTYDMIDIDPFHAVIGNGKKKIIEDAANHWNGADDIFGNQAGGRSSAVCPQDIAGKEDEQGYRQGGNQPDPLPSAIGVCPVQDGPEMDQDQQKEQLAGIEMQRAERGAKRNKHVE